MKRIISLLLSVFVVFLAVSATMFFFGICPPNGPWPTPPWCDDGSARRSYSVSVAAEHLNQIKAVNMTDTWGRNYNMGMFETTMANLSSSFDRVKDLGAGEVYVHDFHRAVFSEGKDYTSTDYRLVDEIFWNDFRDQSMSETEVEKLVEEAHARGLKLGIKHNISFVNIGKYIKSGISGNIQSSVVSDYQKFNSGHSEEWIVDYFSKWQARLVEKAEMYQRRGVDIMSVSPTWMEPTFAGHEKLANESWKRLIAEVRKVFKGRVHIEVSRYGFFEGRDGQEDWTAYDFYKSADIVELRLYDLFERYRDLEMEKGLAAYLEDLNAKAGEKGVRVSLFFAPSSYKDSLKSGALEVLDYNSEAVKKAVVDYDYQVAAFNAVFLNLKDKSNIERINVASFAWDDELDPDVKPRLSVASGFRNKPAEEVVKAWFNK